MTKNNKQIFINFLNFFKMENVKKEEQQFTAPVENAAEQEQQVEKKPWYKKTWGKIMIAAAAVGLGVVGAVAVKKLKTTETSTDNSVEVEEQKETPRENNNNNRRERFEARRQQWNQQ